MHSHLDLPLRTRISFINVEYNLGPKLAQESTDFDAKFLSVRYHSITDSWSYKIALSLSSNKRGITDGKLLSYAQVEKGISN